MKLVNYVLKCSTAVLLVSLSLLGCVTKDLPPPESAPPSEDVTCPEIVEIVEGNRQADKGSECYDGIIQSFEVERTFSENSDYEALDTTERFPTCTLRLNPKIVPARVVLVEVILDGQHQGYYKVADPIYLPKLVGRKQIFLVFTDVDGNRVGSLHKYVLNFGD